MSTPVATKYVTGFCSTGCHEGLKPKSPSGKPLKVCTFWMECGCKCHKEISEMYDMVGEPREPHQNSDYMAPSNTYYMPVFGVDYGMDTSPLDAVVIELPATLERPASNEPGHRIFAPTPSGYAARGQLEDQVLEVVTEWLIDASELCTPSFISWEIARVHKTKEPSTGAISAVFDRWVKYGYAVIGTKPLRFVGLTDEGQARGVEYLKARYKREKRIGSK